MKSFFNLPCRTPFQIVVAAIVLVDLLVACGQTGPLYLPSKPALTVTPANKTLPLLSAPPSSDVPTPASK